MCVSGEIKKLACLALYTHACMYTSVFMHRQIHTHTKKGVLNSLLHPRPIFWSVVGLREQPVMPYVSLPPKLIA